MGSLRELRVLYVEDEEMIRCSMTEMLRRRAREVVVAQDGREGLARFMNDRPDIVITDIEMPYMNGIEMIAAIREISPDIPVVVITAYNDEKHRADKANVTLFKPIAIRELEAAIDAVIA